MNENNTELNNAICIVMPTKHLNRSALNQTKNTIQYLIINRKLFKNNKFR